MVSYPRDERTQHAMNDEVNEDRNQDSIHFNQTCQKFWLIDNFLLSNRFLNGETQLYMGLKQNKW